MKTLQTESYSRLLLTFSTLFIIALTWHISYPSNILVVGLGTILGIIYFKNPLPISPKTLSIIWGFTLLFVFFLMLNLTLYKSDFDLILAYIKKTGFSLLLFVFILLFYKTRKKLLAKSIDYALIAIVSLWFIQLIGYYVTGHYLDVLEPIAGADRAQRYEAYFIQSVLPINIIRPTSIFIEPGTYAVSTFPLLALSYLFHKRLTKLHIFVLASYFGTLSFFAWIISTLFIVTVGLANMELKLTKKNLIIILIAIIAVVGIYEYYTFRFVTQHGTKAIALREQVFHYWFAQDSSGMLLGQGFANTIFSNRAVLEDVSFVVNVLFQYGIFAIPFFALLIYISWGLPVLFLGIILLTKLHPQIYVVWFYFAALHLIQLQRKELKHHSTEAPRSI